MMMILNKLDILIHNLKILIIIFIKVKLKKKGIIIYPNFISHPIHLIKIITPKIYLNPIF
jgi:hypothetical protein